MEIICIESIDSTHIFLCDKVRNGEIKDNYAIYALEQNMGIGSRDNTWQSSRGNLHLSFCIKRQDLSEDLPLSSISIYFGFLLKELLAKKGSKVWLKWPNDLYIEDKKVGGLLSTKIKDFIIVGLGVNLVNSPKNATILDIKIDLKGFIEEYLKEIQKKILWKNIFRKYMIEFEKSKIFSIHYEGEKVSLSDASLYEDGSILIKNKRMYSLR